MPRPRSEAPGSAYLAERLNTTPVRHTRNTAIVSRDVAGETIVVPICRGVGDLDSVYTFNPVGKGLWQLLEQGSTAEELANWVATQYQVDVNQALTDVQGYLAELHEIGLIRVS
jgi:hypothetical protein